MTDPKDTLIIVTADHGHTFTLAGYPHRGNDILGLVRPVPKVDGQNPAPALAADGMPYTTLGYANGPGAVNGARSNPGSVDTTAPDYRQQATVPFRGDAETHGGEDVAIFASGPMAHLVHGSMEQNWIYYVMKEAFGF
jgi:alkaline phosphatase